MTLPHDLLIFREMMSHPVLYTHSNPNDLIILGDEDHTILPEILKHARLHSIHHVSKNKVSLSEDHTKVHYHFTDPLEWLKNETQPVDIIINVNTPHADYFSYFFKYLNPQGILLQQSDSLFKIEALKEVRDQCLHAGFKDLQIVHFPQSHSFQGSKTALMAIKQGSFKRISEKTIYNKNFVTDYYNFDIHKASMALPEFLRREWIK